MMKLTFDCDGLAIPDVWVGNPNKWRTLPLNYRKKRSDELVAEAAIPPKPEKPRKPGATRFSTSYCIRWGRKQGWKLIDRENYDKRTGRFKDLQLGIDALMDSPLGMVGIQGAGVSERAEHYRRFEERGGVEKATRRHIRILYLEFERGDFGPVKVEWWAGHEGGWE